jgi:hypothetical protein
MCGESSNHLPSSSSRSRNRDIFFELSVSSTFSKEIYKKMKFNEARESCFAMFEKSLQEVNAMQ